MAAHRWLGGGDRQHGGGWFRSQDRLPWIELAFPGHARLGSVIAGMNRFWIPTADPVVPWITAGSYR